MITGDGRYVLIRIPTLKKWSSLADWKMLRTDDGECIWQTTDEFFVGISKQDDLYKISSDNCYITDYRNRRIFELYWVYSQS